MSDRDTPLYYVQVARGKKHYRTKYIAMGGLKYALKRFNMLKLPDGYKKRLYCGTTHKTIIKEENFVR